MSCEIIFDVILSKASRCLEIIHGFDDGFDGAEVGEVFKNLVHWLVCHWRFVDGFGRDACRVNALHGRFEIFHFKAFAGLRAAHEAACSVWPRLVRGSVAFAANDKRTISHVHRDDGTLSVVQAD